MQNDYKIIGVMTGNSMDAIDIVLTEFSNNVFRDICSYSVPFTKKFQTDMDKLRSSVFNKTKKEILKQPLFHKVHNEYITLVADAINSMCQKYDIDKKNISAIGFHGKTLDHNPPSYAKKNRSLPYTLQMGSGQMLANLTGIPVVYDFRSAFIMAGFEGAPLVPTHTAHISNIYGDACYYNGGNTSNFSYIINGETVVASDAGPCNEYVDYYIRKNTDMPFDKDGLYGKSGQINRNLLQDLFSLCKDFYEMPLPKSGDPQYYKTDKVLNLIDKYKINFNDAVRTLEYFSAYIAAYSLTLIQTNVKLPNKIFLFGGAWKNPIIYESFEKIVNNNDEVFILPQHKQTFKKFLDRFADKFIIKYSDIGEMMEARTFADMAMYRLQEKPWHTPETTQTNTNIISGIIATPNTKRKYYDKINQAAKGWQTKGK
jgi:anhydro-N-acetylmuramic acid kinase